MMRLPKNQEPLPGNGINPQFSKIFFLMLDYVIDANVVFSGLISGNPKDLGLASGNHVYLPDFALAELQVHQEVVWKKTKQRPDELKQFALAFFKKATVVPNMLISLSSYRYAFELCKDVDPKDMTYVALAIEFGYPLLTRHKPLANGLRATGFTNVTLLGEIIGQ